MVLNVGNHKLTDNYVSSMGGSDNIMPIVVSSKYERILDFYNDIVQKRT